MSRALAGGASRAWVALVGTMCALLVLVAPSALTTANATPLALAAVTMALALLLRLDLRSVAVAAAGAPRGLPPSGGRAPLVLAGRVTDPVHHPLRPRAPGTA